MRRTKEDARKTRAAIIESAERLFVERGVAHTSLDHIARDAGVTRGAVYWHFQNKAHLFHELLSQVRLPPEQLVQRLARCEHLDPLQALFDYSVEAVGSLSRDERRLRVFTILLHRCEFTEELREAEERHFAHVEDYIRLCERLFASASQRLRPGVTPRAAARALHAQVVGLFTDWTRTPKAYVAQDAVLMIEPVFVGLLSDWRQ